MSISFKKSNNLKKKCTGCSCKYASGIDQESSSWRLEHNKFVHCEYAAIAAINADRKIHCQNRYGLSNVRIIHAQRILLITSDK